MVLPVLDNARARRLFLDRHGLGTRPAHLGALFDQLAFVQLDSINSVARAHHMIIHARLPGYRPADLDRLMVADRAVFEHWTHDASIIAMKFFLYWRLRFERAAVDLRARWAKDRRAGFSEKIAPVLARIAADGPLCSSDVSQGEARVSGGWWDWHPSKTALEYLWHSGQVAVCHWRGFRKFYDLTERVIPDPARAPAPDTGEIIDWNCQAAIDRLGFATRGEIARFFATVTAKEARDWCARELGAGQLIEIEVEAADGSKRAALARPDVIAAAANAPDPPATVRILSPFDPALRDRARTAQLFGFDYTIEVFVPAAKRQYGYYVFPVLEGDRLIGRIDMKADRKSDCLLVTRFWPETGIAMGKGRVARLGTAVDRCRRLAGVSRAKWAADWLPA